LLARPWAASPAHRQLSSPLTRQSVRAPYLIFGFDVDPAVPNADAIIQDVQANFPPLMGIAPLGVANMFVVDVPPSQMLARHALVSQYFAQKDQAHLGVLRWIVQLCRSREVSIG
jgi:hypothetical protein